MDGTQRSVEEVMAHLSKIETRKEARPALKHRRETPKQQRNGRSGEHRPDHKGDDEGRPISNSCGKSDRIHRECPTLSQSFAMKDRLDIGL